MKLKYECNQFVISIIVIFIIMELYFIIYMYSNKVRIYKITNSVVKSDKLIELVVNDQELKSLSSYKYIYIDNKRYLKNQNSLTKNILRRNSKYYHQLVLELELEKKYKVNDVIMITIYDKKEKIISIFKTCWKENNEKN